MKKFSWVLFFCGLVTTALLADAKAADRSVFPVPAVVVESEEGSLNRAQSQAVDQAAEQGLERLFRTIIPQTSRYMIPQLMEKANSSALLSRYKILSEETSPTYKLTVDLFFDRSGVRRLLEQNRVPYSEAGNSNVLVVPLLDDGAQKVLWKSTNFWLRAIQNMKSEALGPITFVVPEVNNSKVLRISPEMAAYGASDLLLDLAADYNAENVVVARAWVSSDHSNQNSVRIALNWYGLAGFAPLEADIPLPADESFLVGVDFAAKAALQKMQDQWQTESLVELDHPGQVFVRFTPEGPADLEKLKSEIAALSIVKSVRLRVLNTRASLFEVNYYGAADRLMQSMADRGLSVEQKGSVWVVRLR